MNGKREAMTPAEAKKIVRIKFHNRELLGRQHQFIKNDQIVVLKDGEEYFLPEHIVRQLERSKFPHYEISGDMEGPTPVLKRRDAPRFFIERLPMEKEKEKSVLEELVRPITEAQKEIAAAKEEKEAIKETAKETKKAKPKREKKPKPEKNAENLSKQFEDLVLENQKKEDEKVTDDVDANL